MRDIQGFSAIKTKILMAILSLCLLAFAPLALAYDLAGRDDKVETFSFGDCIQTINIDSKTKTAEILLLSYTSEAQFAPNGEAIAGDVVKPALEDVSDVTAVARACFGDVIYESRFNITNIVAIDGTDFESTTNMGYTIEVLAPLPNTKFPVGSYPAYAEAGSYPIAQVLSWDAATPSALAVGETGTLRAVNDQPQGADIVYSSLTSETCTVSGDTVTAVAAGTCTVAADAPAVAGSGGGSTASAPLAESLLPMAAAATGAGYEAAKQITQDITVSAVETKGPSANAGSDQDVASGANVTLDGSGSVAGDAEISSYQWVQASGDSVTLSGADTATASFAAPTLKVGDPDMVMSFTLTVTDAAGATSGDTVAVTVMAEESQDEATRKKTQEDVAQMQQTRANQLIMRQPDLISRFDRTGQDSREVSADVRGRSQTADINFSYGTDSSTWSEGSVSINHDGTSKSDYGLLAIGVDGKIGKNLLLGGLVELDHVATTDMDYDVSGTGALAGPYMVYKSPVQPIYLEGRVLFGRSWNTYTPNGMQSEDFETNRLLAMTKVEGEIERETFVLKPAIQLSYTRDELLSYTNAYGVSIPGQVVELTQFEVGAGFEREVDEKTTFMGDAGYAWNSTNSTEYARGVLPGFEEGRGNVSIGVHHQISRVTSFEATGFYDGIGADSYDSFGANFTLKLDF